MTPPERLVSVVEDEDTIREMVCLALTKAGYRTEAFGDGLSAWEAFVRALPDLVILDIGLPRLDGLEICRRLRTRSANLPIIFVTSREDEFDRVLGLELTACPFAFADLLPGVLARFWMRAVEVAFRCGPPSPPCFDSPEALLEALARAGLRSQVSAGLGRDVLLEAPGLSGRALVREAEVAHWTVLAR